MVSIWPRAVASVAFRQVFLRVFQYPVDVAAHAAQVAPIDRGVDVDQRLDIIVADDAGPDIAEWID